MLPNCPTCQRGKAQRLGAYTKHKTADDKPVRSGQEVTSDYVVAHSEESQGITGDKDALIIGNV